MKFAEMGWDSAKFETEVIRYVFEKGYNCTTNTTPASNAIALQGVETNDLNVVVEYWSGRTAAYDNAGKEGKVEIVGSLIKGGSVEGYYVPDYLVHGDAARGIKPLAPDLKTITDLAKYKQLFSDDDEPSKGRLYNCPIGWQCESDTAQKLKAYNLDSSYTNFHPGSGPALDAAIESAMQRGKPIVFYYWAPSTILGRFKTVKLEEPKFNEACWKTINSSKDATPCGSASPATTLEIVTSTEFGKGAPELLATLKKVSFPIDSINNILAKMSADKIPARDAAIGYLKSHPEAVKQWVPEAVADRVNASLK
ncbi:glycine betaine ABC transporter substrate-binding protein [Caballeronia sp. DA-9]|uniref:glycine betaine ABC transporter substrate-binding protein n=1 Tax=Caballeronia sp. DA-9 TaxID=3436237 RepID=UPI003F66DAE3